jgi:hypothetical protein
MTLSVLAITMAALGCVGGLIGGWQRGDPAVVIAE